MGEGNISTPAKTSVYYRIVGNEKAQEFFYIDPRTGVVSLKKSIANDNTARYQVD